MIWFVDLILGSGVWCWLTYELTRRKSPPRRWIDAYTPSTCTVAGHDLDSEGYCVWCDDVTVFPGWCDGSYYFMDTGNSCMLRREDPRVVRYEVCGERYKTIPGHSAGRVSIDRSKRDPSIATSFDLPAANMSPDQVRVIISGYEDNAKAQASNGTASSYQRAVSDAARSKDAQRRRQALHDRYARSF